MKKFTSQNKVPFISTLPSKLNYRRHFRALSPSPSVINMSLVVVAVNVTKPKTLLLDMLITL